MEDVIGSILDIENKAGEIIEEGKKEKALLEAKLKKDIDKMRKDINLMVEAKLMQLDKDEKEDAKKSLIRINKTADKRLDAMDEFYKNNRDSWAQSVFELIIGSEKSGA